MRRALVLLALLAAFPARGQEAARSGFSRMLATEVYATALAFMVPRILEEVPIPQLTLWGLRGLTTLDPALTPELDGEVFRLRAPDRVLVARPSPPPGDSEAWAALAAEMAAVAAEVSPSVRQAGTEGVIRSFFDELFNHLDPYSRYVPPGEAAADRAHRSGVSGVGIELGTRGRAVVVTGIDLGGPAAGSGLRAGDEIVAVDGAPLRDASPELAAARLAGPDGSAVVVTVRRRNGREAHVRLTRALVPPLTVFARREGDLLVLRITAFSSDTASLLADALARAGEPPRPARGVVLDLRGNRGGVLQQAAMAAGTLMPESLVAITAGRHPQSSHELRAGGRDLTGGLPVVVIVDGRSASAAEILAAALADDGRAVVVGSATLGKGLVQTISPLPDGGELFVTWSRVLAPLGWPIQGLGVLPQLCTSLGGTALARQLADLARGLDDLGAALARHRAARAPVPASEMVELRAACPAAEGGDADLVAARALIADPPAYDAALLPTALRVGQPP